LPKRIKVTGSYYSGGKAERLPQKRSLLSLLGKNSISLRNNKKAPGIRDFSFRQFYTGWYYPNKPELRLVHEDEEMAKSYKSLAIAKRLDYKNIKDWKVEHDRQFEEGAAALLPFLIFGAGNTLCDNPNVSDADKSANECMGY